MSIVSLREGQNPPPSYGATQTTQFNSSSGSSSSNSELLPEKVENHLAVSVEGVSATSGSQHVGPFISFHDMTYEVNTGCCGRGGRKVILNSVSGYMPKGVNAIMGPTGSGKTSLLDILANRKGRAGIGGVVLVNGERQPKNFKCMSGYVVQDDVVMGTLTVRENLHFSAALRLPSNTSWHQRKERVEKVIDELGLHACANTKIGTEFIRGVSGGERKRTTIGMELIIEPQVLFLDEPTTGLDANTAVSVVRLLKQLADRKDQVVIMSIHQPRYSIFKLFDSLTLLSVGNEVYHGPARHALSYFDNLGFPCEEHENPADFFLDVLTLCEQEALPTIEEEEENGDSSATQAQPLDLVTCYQQSELQRQVAEKLQPLLDSLHEREQQNRRWGQNEVARYATSFVWQWCIVGVRSVVNLVRTPQASLFQVIVMMILALLVGAIYYRLDKKDLKLQTVINDRIGALFFIILTQIFGNLSAIDVFVKQKALFIHENANGFYRVSTFFFAKVITDVIPTRILPLIPFCCIVYFMVGFQLDVSKFFIFFLTLTLTSTASTALAFAISAPFTVVAVANLLIALCFVLQMLFGGFLISLDSLPVYVQWLKYLSIFRYATEALAINEIALQFYNVTCTNNSMIFQLAMDGMDGFSITEDINCIVNGTETLIERGFETSTAWLWYDQIALAAFSILFLLITYVVLRLLKKNK